MAVQKGKSKILFVCGGNTCRSPMAKAIMVEKLKGRGLLDKYEIDSAAYDGPTSSGASSNAKEAIKKLYGDDLLASHKAKKLTPELIAWADLILVTGARMKKGLSQEKTFTLRESAGELGDIADPFGGGLDIYLECAREMSDILDKIIIDL